MGDSRDRPTDLPCRRPSTAVNTEEDPIDELKLVSVDEKLEALEIKGDANAAFAGRSCCATPLSSVPLADQELV